MCTSARTLVQTCMQAYKISTELTSCFNKSLVIRETLGEREKKQPANHLIILPWCWLLGLNGVAYGTPPIPHTGHHILYSYRYLFMTPPPTLYPCMVCAVFVCVTVGVLGVCCEQCFLCGVCVSCVYMYTVLCVGMCMCVWCVFVFTCVRVCLPSFIL